MSYYTHNREINNPVIKLIIAIAVILIGLFIVLPIAGTLISVVVCIGIIAAIGALIFTPVITIGSAIIGPLARVLIGICCIVLLILLITGTGILLPLIAVGLIIAGITALSRNRNYPYRNNRRRF